VVSVGHAEVAEALGAWALDACPEGEAAEIEAHLATCARCSAAADLLRETAAALGGDEAVRPPAALRTATRVAAFGRRAPFEQFERAVTAYSAAFAGLDALLAELTPAEWRWRSAPSRR